MKRVFLTLGLACLLFASTPPKEPRFRRYFVAAESYESVGLIDVNKDGLLDIVSGDFWYENTTDPKTLFRKRHLIGNQKRHDQYYDDFSTIPLDVNGDGHVDVVTGGWWSATLRWLENPGPGKEKLWPIHEIAKVGNVETTRAWDVDGDGVVEIVPNNPKHPLKYFKLGKDASFQQVQVAPTQDHGLGFGDVNGDGKGDFIVSNGWLENEGNNTWKLHNEFELGTASVPILVVDVNGDRKNDLIVGQGHGYGLHWYEQTAEQGKRGWKKHIIDDKASQYHVMEWADLNGDKKPDLITGKRFRAHNDNDNGAYDDVGLYYFTWDGQKFTKHTISYGPPGAGKGTGIYFALADLRKTGRLDIVVAGKDGLEIFFNE
ncbi:FG-GAP repeat domain-containing protein [Tellurirhabdus bombi]|uniref:FG-GAP repeat domain-containing protein n=1 Tax=Tellurirhabdus bombi TaxID=2907205 RepID=UPI001F3BD752|nr:VCBS repeat-containing protein [Tellurirhabdus bombi]